MPDANFSNPHFLAKTWTGKRQTVHLRITPQPDTGGNAVLAQEYKPVLANEFTVCEQTADADSWAMGQKCGRQLPPYGRKRHISSKLNPSHTAESISMLTSFLPSFQPVRSRMGVG